ENVGDVANETDTLEAALLRAKAVEDKPSLVILRSHIGYPSPKFTDSELAHGNPLGEDEIKVTKEILGLPPEKTFYVPDDVFDLYRTAGARGARARAGWESRRNALSADRRTVWDACQTGGGIEGWSTKLPRGRWATRSRPARPPAPASRRSSTWCPASWAAAPTSPATRTP
ncbi:MAG: hypothetical protein ABIV94_08365, partial [Acidimicrobiales bacterium]